jgi:predicted CopG family antitoxin
MTTNTAITTIQLELEVRKRLQSLGKKGETYNDIIKRLIKKAAYVDFMEEQYAILDNEKNWVSLDDL